MANTLGKTLKNLPGPVLITGHTGFKGTWMTLFLEQLGVSVIGYSLKPEKDSLYHRAKLKGRIPEKFADIRNYNKLKKFVEKHQPSIIFHMAAQPLVLESYKIPLETFDINVKGTANLLDIAFQFSSVKVAVIVTTDKVYRNNESGKSFVETDPLEGKDPYSASKVGTEAVVRSWQQISEVSGGPKVVSVRAGNVIGGGDFGKDRLIPDIIRSHISGRSLEIRNLESTRPWQHVLDVLRGYLLTTEYILKGNQISNVNFGPNEKGVSVRKVLSAFQRQEFLQNLKIKEAEVDSVLESQYLELDSSKAQTLLNWKPIWNQDFAINKTAKWWENVMIDKLDSIHVCNNDIIEYNLTALDLESSEG